MKRFLRVICILIVTVLILTANTVFSVAADQEEAVDLRELLTIRDEENMAYLNRLRDGYYGSRISYTAGSTVSVCGSSDIGYAYIAWQKLPDTCTITWLDADQKKIYEEKLSPARLDEYIPAPQEGVCGYSLTFSQACAVSELSAYTPGRLPQDAPQFEAPLQKATVLLIAGFPGDELVCFGGLLPSLIQEGVPVQVVYLNPYDRERQEECLRALWKLGMRNEPIFINTTGIRSLDSTVLKSTMEKNGEVSKRLLEVIDGCTPDVIVTHGKTRHFPLMAEEEMAYTVVTGIHDRIKRQSWLKKIYFVTEKGAGNAVTFDFSQGYAQAAAVYAETYASMRTFHYTLYKDDAYALYFTNGNKYKEGDMLSNISYTPLNTPEPTATPTPEPTKEPTPGPTATPTEVPTFTPAPTETILTEATVEPTQAAAPAAPVVSVPSTPVPTPMPRLADTGTVLAPILLSAVLAAAVFVVLIVLKRVVRRKMPVIVGIAAPILAALILCVGLYRAAAINQRQEAAAIRFEGILAEAAAASVTEAPTFTPEPTAAPTAVPTQESTPVPTAAPTEEPTPEPTATPTATPDPEAGLYTAGEEQVSADAEAGKWIYKNGTLSIEITRYTGQAAKMEFPYFVADIHMRADEFRAGFGHEQRSGTGKDDAMSIAKRYHAVLMVTGDNLIHMDKDKKGVLIRDGWVYQDSKKGDLMLWHPETLSIELIPKEKITSAQSIVEAGVENCVSFGPILIQNGVRTGEKTLENNWLFKTNPRVGVGMVEPGHFIVIMGGYRSDYPKANLGWDLNQFTDLMASFGCREAYNMDGGVSACIIFMGERLNKGGNKKDWSQLRTLPDGLIFGYSEQVHK